MKELTLDEALAIVVPWIHGTHTSRPRVATDALAMQVVRKLIECAARDEIDDIDLSLSGDGLTAGVFMHDQWIRAYADDPRDAVIIAAAQWLKAQQSAPT